MFNILGILLALIISNATRGSGVFVGWESGVAAGVGTLAVFIFYWGVASNFIDRYQINKLRIRAVDALEEPRLRAELEREKNALTRRVPVVRMAVDAMIIGLYVVICWVFGWVDYVNRVWGVPLYLDLVPHLLPYFAMLLASWVGQYRLESNLRGGWRPLNYFGFQARANLMTIAPIALIYVAYYALLTYVPAYKDLSESFLFLEIAVQIPLVLVIAAFVPVIIRAILPGGRLPEGRLRRRLETFARDRGLKVNEILVWRTGSSMLATAFVIGLLSPFRYVFITDALLDRMDEDEILAVFAHELGHVKHRHLWWLLGFVLSFSIILWSVMMTLGLYGLAGTLELPALALILAYGYVIFGYISRRFERQADAFAARHTSPELISGVLLKLGMSNPMAMKKTGWRHFSLERRVREIVQARAHPEVKDEFRSELRKGLTVAVLVTVVACAMLIQPIRDDYVSGLATYSLTQFDRAHAGNANPTRLNELRERTLQRSASMGELNENYELAALWYEGIVEGLSGRDTEALDKLTARFEEKQSEAETEREQDAWAIQIKDIEATQRAIQAARENGTSFFEEFEKERRRLGIPIPAHPGS